MLQLRDIMTADVVTITPDASVRDALELLGQRHVSGAPVVSRGKLVGVVTATDLMRFAASLPGVPVERETGDAWGVWAEASAKGKVADEPDSPGGFFSDLWDDSGADVTQRLSSIEGPEWNVLEEHDVDEIMTRTPLVTLPPTADAEAAAELMNEKHIHRVLVTEGERLVGIVSALDIAKAVADHRLTKRTYVFNRDDEFRDSE